MDIQYTRVNVSLSSNPKERKARHGRQGKQGMDEAKGQKGGGDARDSYQCRSERYKASSVSHSPVSKAQLNQIQRQYLQNNIKEKKQTWIQHGFSVLR